MASPGIIGPFAMLGFLDEEEDVANEVSDEDLLHRRTEELDVGPQAGQVSMSMPNTRFRRCAQVMVANLY